MVTVVTEAAGYENQHDRTLLALAQSNNIKQALVHIDKRLKKVKSDRLVLNKALLQLQMTADANSYDQAVKLLETVIRSLSPIKDNDVLHAVEEMVRQHSDSKRLQIISNPMWDGALKARPNDDGLLNELFERKIFTRDWDAARKLAMTKMKTQRDWYFRYLMCLHLSASSKQSDLPENMKEMNAGLACKSLQKAAMDVVPDPAFVQNPTLDPGIPGEVKFKNTATSSRSIETRRELDLLVEILQYHEKFKELLSILEDDTRTGTRSRIGYNLGTLRDKVQVLRRCKEWKMLWGVCDDLLRPVFASNESTPKSPFGKLADDWETWQAYLEASLHLHDSDTNYMKEALALAFSAAQSTIPQNAILSLIDHSLRHREIYEQHGQSALTYIQKYYALYSQKPYVFQQLKNVSLLGASEHTRLLSSSRSTSHEQGLRQHGSKYLRRAWLFSEINSLKLDYYLVISRAKQASRPLLDAFISNCLRLYEISFLWDVESEQDSKEHPRETEGATDRHVGDDAALLAAMALIRLYILGDDNSLIRATFLLEIVLRHSKHNYEVVLLTIRLYVYLGQAGRAFELFNSLDVKNVQKLYIFWIIICRISTIHPHSSKNLLCNPLVALEGADQWVRKSQKAVNHALSDCLHEKSYRNFLKTISTFESINTSISNLMIIAEISNIRWLSAVQPPLEIPRGALDESDYPDTREATAFPNYEHPSQATIESLLRPGPLPKKNWCGSKQRFWALLQIFQGNPMQHEVATAISSLFSHRTATHTKESGKHEENDMTRLEVVEDQVFSVCFDLLMLACASRDMAEGAQLDGKRAQAVRGLIQTLVQLTEKDDLEALLPEIDADKASWYGELGWSRIHGLYQRIYALKSIVAAMRLLSILEQHWKITVDVEKDYCLTETKRLESLAREATRKIKDWARTCQVELKKPGSSSSIAKVVFENVATGQGVLAALMSVKFGDAICVDAKGFAKSLVNGWIDALDGFAIIDETHL